MLKKIRFTPRTIPLAILLLALLTYGLMMPWLGFYWDDWPFAFLSHFFGPKEFLPAFAPFRPFLGPIFVATTTFLRESILGWQVFGLLIRFLTGLAAWWTFRKVWPERQKEVLAVALFFLVFPGYGQQWISFTHTNQELIPLLAYLLSLGVMAWAHRSPARFWPLTLLALFLTFWSLFTTEYTFGLEALRPLILWFLWSETSLPVRERLAKTLKSWAPYLVLWIANAVWLTLYHRSSAYNSYDLKAFSFAGLSSPQVILKAVQDAIQAVSVAGFSSWAQTLQIFTQPFNAVTAFLVLGVTAIALALVFFYLSRLDLPEKAEAGSRWAAQALLIGVVGILAGRLPSWAAGLPVSLQFSWDRFMLSMMLGASFFFVGLVDFLIKNDYRKTLFLSLFIALAVGAQFENANTYRRDWDNQQKFFWQLAWRIPGLQPDTLLVTHELPFTYVSDFSLSAPLNWMYASNFSSHQMPYMLAYTRIRLNGALLPGLKPGLAIQFPYRTLEFTGSTSDAVVLFQPAPGCLRVMDPVYSDKETAPGVTYMLSDAIPLSNLSRIETGAQPPRPSPAIFGREPAHTWCYLFEKAELARQDGDWPKVVDLWKESQQKGFTPENSWELLPFTEALARTGDLDAAGKLSDQISSATPDLGTGLCQLWERVKTEAASLGSDQKSQIATIQASLNCAP